MSDEDRVGRITNGVIANLRAMIEAAREERHD